MSEKIAEDIRGNIPEEIIDQLKILMEDTSIESLNRGLRNMLIDYLRLQADGLPANIEDFLGDIYILFQLLDAISDHRAEEK